MDPGTALSAISLALELPRSLKSIVVFLSTIKEAPNELVTLIETLEQMQACLDQVRGLAEQFSDARLAGSLVFIFNALKLCEKRVKPLSDLVKKLENGSKSGKAVRRTWTSLNVAFRKSRLKEVEGQVKDAMGNLHFVITAQIVQLQ